MPTAPRRSPLDGTDRVIVDGTNLLYRIGAKAGGPAPASAVVGRIRGAIPVAVAIDLVFDGVGHGVYGRLAQNMLVRYSGKRSGDDVILDLVSEAAMQGHGGPAAADRVLVISSDRPLRDRVSAKGGRSVPLQWLTARLDLPAQPVPASGSPGSGGPPGRAPTIGAGKPRPAPTADREEDAERPRWKPGRGATAKSGAPRKVARHKRHPR
jgi:rRNA-processing protein FCF1